MPPAAISIGSRLRAQFAVLSLAPPGSSSVPFGIILIDSESGRLEWKLREDFDDLPLSEDDIEYVACLDTDFRARLTDAGGAEFLRSLEDSLSGFLRISDREFATGSGFTSLLDRLFDRHVDTRVRPFVTHLPYYGLRAAATRFGEDSEVSETDITWLRAPAGLRVAPNLFIVQVVGRSMEPLIPDGSLVIFRKTGAGSRQGKRLLIEELGTTGSSARFTVKRYISIKVERSDEEWSHGRIRLEPLNPEFPSFDLDPEEFEGKYRVIGEFVQVLPASEPEDAS